MTFEEFYTHVRIDALMIKKGNFKKYDNLKVLIDTIKVSHNIVFE